MSQQCNPGEAHRWTFAKALLSTHSSSGSQNFLAHGPSFQKKYLMDHFDG